MVDATTIIEYTHPEFEQGIKAITKQIEEDDFEADYLIGIARGGCVPGVYLSHSLRKPIMMIQWNTRDDNPFGNDYPTWLPRDLLSDKKVIIIDDIVDGGTTLMELFTSWQGTVGGKKIPLQNIRIAAMYYNIAQDIKVDYYHRTINRDADDRWIVFHWEAV
jgi:hypoxanthine phosphoribosyltransferase